MHILITDVTEGTKQLYGLHTHTHIFCICIHVLPRLIEKNHRVVKQCICLYTRVSLASYYYCHRVKNSSPPCAHT